jgi:hypothetical protein
MQITAIVAAGIYPGGSEKVIFTAANRSGSPVLLNALHLVGVTADRTHADCDTDAFTMRDVPESTRVMAGATAQVLPSRGTLRFRNTGENQDACKGATLTLSLSSS